MNEVPKSTLAPASPRAPDVPLLKERFAMKADNEIVETSHGPATVAYVRENDIPYWQGAAAHAQGVLQKLLALVGAAPPKPKCPHCNKEI